MQSNRMRWLSIIQFLTPFVALLIALLIGAVILLATGRDPFAVFSTLVSFSVGDLAGIGSILFRATPLIFSGLAFAVAYKLKLFNIGVEGQYYVGAFFAAVAAARFGGLPIWLHLPLVMVTAMAAGMIWAYIPIWLKIHRGAHEVITTIMMNYIAFSLVHYLLADIFIDRQQTGSPRLRTPEILASAEVPGLHRFLGWFGLDMPDYVAVNWFFIAAVAAAGLLYWLVRRTAWGFELRTVGANEEAARASGIDPNRMLMQAFLASGALAGLVGLSDLLGYFGYFNIDFPQGYGFTGIAVALVGKNNALGIIPAALLFGFLDRGGIGIQTLENVPIDTVVILQGVIILSLVTVSEVVGRYIRDERARIEKSQADLEQQSEEAVS